MKRGGTQSLVRQVLKRDNTLTLIPSNPGAEIIHVSPHEVIRWGRILYVSRPVK